MKTHIIGLAGATGAGKKTTAGLLSAHAGFRHLAFADALHAEVMQAFEVDLSLLTDPAVRGAPTEKLSFGRAPVEFRNAVLAHVHRHVPRSPSAMPPEWLEIARVPAQVVEWWRLAYRCAQSPRYWIRPVVERIRYHRRDGETRFVISDCTTRDYADTVHALGGRVWQIVRPGSEWQGVIDRSFVDLVLRNEHEIRHLQGIVRDAFVDLEWPPARQAAA